MKAIVARLLALAVTLLVVPSWAADELGRAECKPSGDISACAPYGCVRAPGAPVAPAVPSVPVGAGAEDDPDLDRGPVVGTSTVPEPEPKSYCGKCTADHQCMGAKCHVGTGTCSAWPASPPPPTVWPHFNLLVGEASLAFPSDGGVQPIIGLGYVFQGAFVTITPVKTVEGPYIVENLPWLYWNAGLTAAFAGASQNVFADLGLTAYYPGFPIAITTIGISALYQRTGAAIWQLGSTSDNQDRLGPALTVGFLQNLYLRPAYLFPIRGPEDTGQFVISVLYMRDLAGDLVPNHLQKYLPEALR